MHRVEKLDSTVAPATTDASGPGLLTCVEDRLRWSSSPACVPAGGDPRGRLLVTPPKQEYACHELFADDLVWHVAGRSVIAGDYAGKDQVFGFFGRLQELSEGTSEVEVHDLLANDEHGVAIVIESATRNRRSYQGHASPHREVGMREDVVTVVLEQVGGVPSGRKRPREAVDSAVDGGRSRDLRPDVGPAQIGVDGRVTAAPKDGEPVVPVARRVRP